MKDRRQRCRESNGKDFHDCQFVFDSSHLLANIRQSFESPLLTTENNNDDDTHRLRTTRPATLPADISSKIVGRDSRGRTLSIVVTTLSRAAKSTAWTASERFPTYDPTILRERKTVKNTEALICHETEGVSNPK